MEGLRKIARSGFRDTVCVGKTSDFNTITILTHLSQPTTYRNEKTPVEQIKSFVRRSSPPLQDAERVTATLQLIRMTRLDNENLCVSPEVFHSMFKAFKLDPSMLCLISNNSYGFHHFPASNGSHVSFFVATVVYILMWSFDPATMTTKAMMFTRSQNSLTNGRVAFDAFEAILAVYQDYIHHPCILAFVAIIHTIQYLDALVLKRLHLLRSVEAYTGHGAFVYAGPRSEKPESILKDINHWSTKVGECLVLAANKRRHAEIVASLIAFCRNPKTDDIDFRASIVDTNGLLKHDAVASELYAALPILERQLQSTKQYISYLQERAQNQSTVLFGLLTHQDAIINTNLASSSTQIAAATKRDGEAMKTIAVMTMLFLPATFFAALFAMPSLHWDEQPVIRTGFNIYWAFTLPATALVFLVWFALTNWDWVVDRTISWTKAKPKQDVPAEESTQIQQQKS